MVSFIWSPAASASWMHCERGYPLSLQQSCRSVLQGASRLCEITFGCANLKLDDNKNTAFMPDVNLLLHSKLRYFYNTIHQQIEIVPEVLFCW